MLGIGKLLGFVHQHGWVHNKDLHKKNQLKSNQFVERGRRNLILEGC